MDTGSPIALTGETGWKKIGSHRLARSYIRLCAYGQRQISVMGECTVDVKCGSTVLQLPLVVVSSGASLLGLNWIQAFQLDINALLYTPKASAELLSADVHTMGVPTDLDLKKVIADHPSIFAPGLGLCTKTNAHLQLRDDVQPKFLKARPLPFSRIDSVEKEVQRLEDLKIVTKVGYSDWATPIVVVQKPSGKVRICGDYRATVNPCLHVQQHPIPRIEELFAKLQGGMHFSKLDMRDAYLQIELDDETKQLLVINTHKGLYRYNRLCFGPSPAPAIFQNLVDNLVAGIPGVAAYLDDIIVTGQTKAEHLENLRRVFAALDNYGLKLQLDKCVFFAPEVSYLGYIISKDGLCASEERVQAILQYAMPTDLKQLESFVGKLNYYGKFLPAFASVCAPLNQLRCKDTPWKWSAECTAAFDELKQMLADKTRLVHFDPEKPIVLATDATPYGIGAVISHVLPDGSEEPIAFASKTLSKAERGYAQVEKDGLSIVYGIRKFNQYLSGRHFTILTDHKPLLTIFGPDKSLPAMYLQRLQRWALLLMGHDYDIRYRASAEHCNADALSRLPAGPDVAFDREEEVRAITSEVQQIATEVVSEFPITWKLVAECTKKDTVLSQVLNFVRNGWPTSGPECRMDALRPFFKTQTEICQVNGVILRDCRVVVPQELKTKVITMLHQSHRGVVRMKTMARLYVWWPNIEASVEACCKACNVCAVTTPAPTANLSPWPLPDEPWDRIHVDFAGPFLGNMWMLVMDAYSKWPSVVRMSKYPTTETTIMALNILFTTWGSPKTLVSDNGPQFGSKQFEDWCRLNGIVHLTSAPFHPPSNGEAERLVGVFKTAMQRSVGEEGKERDKATMGFLREYRSTPNCATGRTPAEMMIGRQVRTPLSLLQPSVHHDKWPPLHSTTFAIRDHVFVRSYGVNRKVKWTPGRITSSLGTRMFTVQCADGIHRRHIDQMRHWVKTSPALVQPPVEELRFPTDVRAASPPRSPIRETPTRDGSPTAAGDGRIVSPPRDVAASPVLRRSARNRRPPTPYSP